MWIYMAVILSCLPSPTKKETDAAIEAAPRFMIEEEVESHRCERPRIEFSLKRDSAVIALERGYEVFRIRIWSRPYGSAWVQRLKLGDPILSVEEEDYFSEKPSP